MDSAGLITGVIRLEQHSRATGNVRNDNDDVSVWEIVAGTVLPRSGNVRRDSDDVSVRKLEDKIDPPIHTESEQPP